MLFTHASKINRPTERPCLGTCQGTGEAPRPDCGRFLGDSQPPCLRKNTPLSPALDLNSILSSQSKMVRGHEESRAGPASFDFLLNVTASWKKLESKCVPTFYVKKKKSMKTLKYTDK